MYRMRPCVPWCLKRIAISFLAAILIFCIAHNKAYLQWAKEQRIAIRKRSSVQEVSGPAKKLYMRLVSRLGNHHFQIATLLGLAKKTGRTPVITSGSGDEVFVLHQDVTIPVLDTITVMGVQTINEDRNFSFTSELVEQIKRHPADVKICCFFESWRYFLPHYEKEIRKELTISKDIVSDVTSHLWKLVTSLKPDMQDAARQYDVTYIGVHVRRGDKLKSTYGFQIAPLTYFKNSITYFQKKYRVQKLVFVVTSDDRKWVRENIKGTNIVYSDLQEAHEDFALLTICNHTITSVGTFSWWAGFLTGGDVLYYKHPTLPGTLKHSRFQPEDFYLPHWIPYE